MNKPPKLCQLTGMFRLISSCGVVDGAKDGDLGDIDQLHALGLGITDINIQALTALTNLGMVGLDIEG